MSDTTALTDRADFVSQLRLRPFRRHDAQEAVDLIPAWLGLDSKPKEELVALWARLADAPAVVSAVQEDMALPPSQRLQAWGLTLIMPRGWLTPYLPGGSASPAACSQATREVYAELLSGRLPLPTEREIGIANAGEGVVFFALHYSQHASDLSRPYALRNLSAANEGLRVMHAGYKVRAFFMQGPMADEAWILTAGLRRRHAPEAAASADRPTLYGLTAEEAAAMMPGQSARVLFEHQAPRFRLSSSQRRLLWLALFDEPDEGLVQDLGVSPHGLKKLWRGIYERIQDVEPEFFGDADEAAEGKRGPEKRRRVLAYVRQRLEELRPWQAA